MADLFGTKGLGGFAYYDRLPDLGRPTSADSDQSNIAAPFVVVFDKKGVRSIANVGTDMEENQQGIASQMFMAKSKSDIHYFFIFLRPTQAKKAEQLWLDAEYCDLYDYLKEIALTEEGAWAGEEGQSPPPSAKEWFERKDIRGTEAVMNIHCEPDEEEEEPEKIPLGSLNWVRFSSENKVRGKIGRDEFLVWGARDGRSRVIGRPFEDWIWDEGEFQDEAEYIAFSHQVEQYGAYSLQHDIWDGEREEWDYTDSIAGIVPSEDYDLIQAAHEFFDLKNPILLGGMNWISFQAEDFPEDEIGLLNWWWKRTPNVLQGYTVKQRGNVIQMWPPAAAAAAETFQSTQSGVNSKYSTRSGTDVEEFSVPFIDISNPADSLDGLPTEEIICVDHLYHGQYSMGGEEITAHSPYWSPNLDFALGHALFGAELEKKVSATRCEYCSEECDKCEDGWVLLNRETDDIIPQTMPIVLQLNFDTEEDICFSQDIEHPKGKSYVLYGESSEWEIVPSNQLIPILERWLEDEEIPEDILFDTGAGYVSDDRLVWNRVKQAIQQLQN